MDVDAVVTFQAPIYLVGQNRCVDVPKGTGFDEYEDPVPVILTVGRRSVRTNLVSRGGGTFRVFINSDLRRAANADLGDVIDVEIRLDLTDREPDVPSDLESALKRAGLSWRQFNELTVNQRREMVAFVQAAKQETTRLRRISRVLEVLEEMSGP
ncbi:MAG: YdeI/OmpD-associated family protein [Candidatus Latescibacterota bacterium]|jgi:hypothetical protein